MVCLRNMCMDTLHKGDNDNDNNNNNNNNSSSTLYSVESICSRTFPRKVMYHLFIYLFLLLRNFVLFYSNWSQITGSCFPVRISLERVNILVAVQTLLTMFLCFVYAIVFCLCIGVFMYCCWFCDWLRSFKPAFQ